MGNIVGKVTDALGLTDFKGQKKAEQRASAQQAKALEMSEEQVAFQREQYADWLNIYGDVQENLGKFYKELGEDNLMALGLENQQREFQAMQTKVKEDFARRGINADSEIVAGANRNLGFQNASARARIRTEAPFKAAEEKMKFLGIGLNQGQAMLGNINAAYNTGVSASASLAGMNTQLGYGLGAQNRDFMQTVVGLATGQTLT